MSILKDCFPTVAIAATAYCFLYYYPFSYYKIFRNEKILMFQLFRDKLDLLYKLVSYLSGHTIYLVILKSHLKNIACFEFQSKLCNIWPHNWTIQIILS